MNRTAALNRLGGNERLFAELVGFFLEDAPLLMQRLPKAAEHLDNALEGLCEKLQPFAYASS
jgi:hypothetical protein